MKVKFVSLYGQDAVFIPDLGGETSFEHGEERELSDADAAIVLTNPNFVDAATGKNPNFSCATCGGFRSDSAITDAGLVPHTECLACRTPAPQIAPTLVSVPGAPEASFTPEPEAWRDAEAVNAHPVASTDLYQ